MESAHSYENVSTTFRDMVLAPVEHNDHRGHHILGEPLTSRHDLGKNSSRDIRLYRYQLPKLQRPAKVSPFCVCVPFATTKAEMMSLRFSDRGSKSRTMRINAFQIPFMWCVNTCESAPCVCALSRADVPRAAVVGCQIRGTVPRPWRPRTENAHRSCAQICPLRPTSHIPHTTGAPRWVRRPHARVPPDSSVLAQIRRTLPRL